MTNLLDIAIPTKQVSVSDDQTLSVHGISMESLSVMVRDHLPEMTMAFGAIKKAADDGEVSEDQIDGILKLAFEQAPGLVSTAIALACGYDWRSDKYEAAKKVAAGLPMTVQAECLLAAFELTLRSEAEVKKLLGMFTNLAETANAALTS